MVAKYQLLLIVLINLIGIHRAINFKNQQFISLNAQQLEEQEDPNIKELSDQELAEIQKQANKEAGLDDNGEELVMSEAEDQDHEIGIEEAKLPTKLMNPIKQKTEGGAKSLKLHFSETKANSTNATVSNTSKNMTSSNNLAQVVKNSTTNVSQNATQSQQKQFIFNNTQNPFDMQFETAVNQSQMDPIKFQQLYTKNKTVNETSSKNVTKNKTVKANSTSGKNKTANSTTAKVVKDAPIEHQLSLQISQDMDTSARSQNLDQMLMKARSNQKIDSLIDDSQPMQPPQPQQVQQNQPIPATQMVQYMPMQAPQYSQNPYLMYQTAPPVQQPVAENKPEFRGYQYYKSMMNNSDFSIDNVNGAAPVMDYQQVPQQMMQGGDWMYQQNQPMYYMQSPMMDPYSEVPPAQYYSQMPYYNPYQPQPYDYQDQMYQNELIGLGAQEQMVQGSNSNRSLHISDKQSADSFESQQPNAFAKGFDKAANQGLKLISKSANQTAPAKKVEHTFFEHKVVDPLDNSTTSMSLHLLISEQQQLEKMQAYSFQQFKQIQKMMIQMQKSQQWSFNNIQVQIDEIQKKIDSNHNQELNYTQDLSHSLAMTNYYTKMRNDMIKNINTTKVDLNCTNVFYCQNGQNCTEVSVCSKNDTCSLMEKCDQTSGECKKQEVCSKNSGKQLVQNASEGVNDTKNGTEAGPPAPVQHKTKEELEEARSRLKQLRDHLDVTALFLGGPDNVGKILAKLEMDAADPPIAQDKMPGLFKKCQAEVDDFMKAQDEKMTPEEREQDKRDQDETTYS